jgi:hypothetical protein
VRILSLPLRSRFVLCDCSYSTGADVCIYCLIRRFRRYLDQIISYEDPMDSAAHPRSETLQFAVKCVEAAGSKLDKMLMYFPDNEIESARQQLSMEVEPQ